MRAFLLFLATVVIVMAVAMPDHFKQAVQHVEFWIEWAAHLVF
jgi:hypothetical protein